MMNQRERDHLIEASVTAHRDRDAEGRLVPPAAWWDLPPEALDELYRRQMFTRAIEQVMDARGLSTTVRAVLSRV